VNEDPTDQILIGTITEQMGDVYRRALVDYLPVVEQILTSGSQDTCRIEITLDGLLDFAAHDSILPLYQRLCRHYFEIDPVAAVFYVNAYREMWNSQIEAGAEACE
jgi:hypothetical protein